MNEWGRYRKFLSGTGQDLKTPTDSSGNLSSDMLDQMNPDQLKRMEQLRDELTKP